MFISNPTVKEVLDSETGIIYPSHEILSSSQSTHHIQRMNDELAILRHQDTKYKCPICWMKLVIRGGPKQTYHFKHPVDPTAQCPYRSNQQMTEAEILARKYDGAKESIEHKRLKSMMVESLEYDSNVEPKSIKLEKRITLIDTKEHWTTWRQPDVQAMRNGMHYVFEVQLATTFLSVVAARKVFYTKNRSALIWLFKEELLKTMSFTYLDIYCNNNFNIFFITHKTVQSSKQLGETRLMCRFESVHREGDQIKTRLQEIEVGLSELQMDTEQQTVFYYDHKKELATLTREIERDVNLKNQIATETTIERYHRLRGERKAFIHVLALENTQTHTIPDAFFKTWIDVAQDDNSDENYRYIWDFFKTYFERDLGCNNLDFSLERKAIISALYSLRENKIIGSKLQNLKGLENLIFSSYKPFYGLFIRGVKLFGREPEIQIQSVGSTAHTHYALYRCNRNTPAYKQDHSLEQLVQYLFNAAT